MLLNLYISSELIIYMYVHNIIHDLLLLIGLLICVHNTRYATYTYLLVARKIVAIHMCRLGLQHLITIHNVYCCYFVKTVVLFVFPIHICTSGGFCYVKVTKQVFVPELNRVYCSSNRQALDPYLTLNPSLW